MRTRLIALGFIVLASCGGPQDKPPGPLSHHFDESFIAQLSVDDQQGVIKAQGEYDVAKREQAKAVADEREAQSMLDIANNELAAAKLDEKSANTRKQAADQSADQNRINEATKEQRGAELARRAAEQRVAYLQSYKAWLHVAVRFTQENTFYKESQLELAEASLAKSHNIQPKGFNFSDYENQEAERRGRINSAKEKSDRAKADAMDKRTQWITIQGEADKTLGKKSEFPDPMAPRREPEGPASAGGGGFTLGSEGGAKSDTHVPTADDPTQRPDTNPGNGSGSGSSNP
ncbi:MAG TPA: hypothetical protein VL463_12880 [Kofleriaceae bacterium]|nr:hypothetical protein [Kofleriaceae bacterium]